jgi:hypothetical protein
VIVLKKEDKTSAFTLSYLLRDLFKQISVLDGRTLIIGHYVGHGAIDAMNHLFFFDSQKMLQKVSLETFEELHDEKTEIFWRRLIVRTGAVDHWTKSPQKGYYAGTYCLSSHGATGLYKGTRAVLPPLRACYATYGRNTDVLMIFDSCFSGLATRGLESGGRSVEIISSVGSTQKAHGNYPDLARAQNQTFTSRLADEVARRVGRGEMTISFAQVIDD